jgi:hypothetical protein
MSQEILYPCLCFYPGNLRYRAHCHSYDRLCGPTEDCSTPRRHRHNHFQGFVSKKFRKQPFYESVIFKRGVHRTFELFLRFIGPRFCDSTDGVVRI